MVGRTRAKESGEKVDQEEDMAGIIQLYGRAPGCENAAKVEYNNATMMTKRSIKRAV